MAWRDLRTPRAEVTYWRTASGHEVDFVIEWRRQLVGVEVKANSQPTLRDVAGMRALLSEHPKAARGGLVLHGGDESYWLDDKIVAVPWWRVL
jgi:predicted AAA+ superfamily ATPase